VAAADHGERPRRVDDGRARPQRDAAAAGVDEVRIGALRRGQRPRSDHAVLRLEEDVDTGPQVVGHVHRHADAEVDHEPIGHVLRGAPGHLAAVEWLCRAHAGTVTTRSTKVPGSWTRSGGMGSLVTARTSATTSFAAVAITGPKLSCA